MAYALRNEWVEISSVEGEGLFRVAIPGLAKTLTLAKPSFELDGKLMGGSAFRLIRPGARRTLRNGGVEEELVFSLEGSAGIELTVVLRYFPSSPFIRFRYVLSSGQTVHMTKQTGRDRIRYTVISDSSDSVRYTEIQFSQFESIVHSFIPHFAAVDENELAEGCRRPGPILLLENEEYCGLLAYEHGAEYPDSYLDFGLAAREGTTEVSLDARKGNYYTHQPVDREHPFVSPWFHFAVCKGGREELLSHYRTFFLKYICENDESRKPRICYNTWNYQERVRYFTKDSYIAVLNQERILAEIDVAHGMGIDVYVIDVPWFVKTGDWEVDLSRFPDGMKKIKEKLDSCGMKLGLWFNPTAAAVTSRIAREHPEFITSVDGNSWKGPVWDTEESYGMCLASDYSDHFIEMLVRCYHEYGATYFKWDAVGQGSCNSPLHNHGDETHSPQERMECFNFKMGMEMVRIAEELTRRCPDAVVDFDITEGGRFVGLGFLAAGKYFLMNNGPYAMDLDLPEKYNYLLEEPIHFEPWTNIYFYPGPARSKICRQAIKFDPLVPSVLFLTHYLPDKPRLSQNNALASIVLGGNGIWGDLLALDGEDIRFFGEALDKYRKVADSVTRSNPRVKGFIGSSPEIYEKIDTEKSQGVVCFFTRAAAEYRHVTQKIDPDRFSHVDGADHWELTPDHRLIITVKLGRDDARCVFILSRE